jgi:hypothetical protein
MRELGFYFKVLVLAGSTLVPRFALGQDPSAQILKLNGQAMSDYQNMKIDSAMETLAEAESLCLQNGLLGHEMAVTYLNMGIIEAAGRMNNAAAMDFFTKAICIEPSIAMDPLVSTPEVETVFNMSKSQAQSPDTCAQLAANVIPPPPPGDIPPPPPGDFLPPDTGLAPPPPPPPGPSGPIPQSEDIRHTAVAQQTKLTPLPLFVQVQPGMPVERVVLSYRTYGERLYQQVEMKKHGDVFATTIGCDVMQSFNPTAIEYYITVYGPGDVAEGYSGNEMQPHQVNMVDVLVGAPPALPDEVPPEKCTEECPPWNPDCNQGDCKQLGDLCDGPGECCKGMVCQDESCVPGDEEGGGPLDPFFRMSITVGTGGGIVFPDKVIPYNQYANTPEAVWKNNRYNIAACNQEGLDMDTCYDQLYRRAVIINTGVSWSKLHFRLNPMFYITEKILLGATFRGGIPLVADEAVMKVSPVGLLSFAYRAVGSGKDRFELDLVAGFGGGFIYHRIEYPDCYPTQIGPGHPWAGVDPSTGEYYDADQLGCYYVPGKDGDPNVDHPDNRIDIFSEWIGPKEDPDVSKWKHSYFKRSGFLVGELGVDAVIWFGNKIGLNIGLAFDIYFPDLALNGDFQVGPMMRF